MTLVVAIVTVGLIIVWKVLGAIVSEVVALEVPGWFDRLALAIARRGASLLPTEELRAERIREYEGLYLGSDMGTPLEKLKFALGLLGYGMKSAKFGISSRRVRVPLNRWATRTNGFVREVVDFLVARGGSRWKHLATGVMAGSVLVPAAMLVAAFGSQNGRSMMVLGVIALVAGVATSTRALQRILKNARRPRDRSLHTDLVAFGVAALARSERGSDAPAEYSSEWSRWDIAGGLSRDAWKVYAAVGEAWMSASEIEEESGVNGLRLDWALRELRHYLQHEVQGGEDRWARTPPLD